MRNDELFRDSLGWKTYPERLSGGRYQLEVLSERAFNHAAGLLQRKMPGFPTTAATFSNAFGAYNVSAVSYAPALLERHLAIGTKAGCPVSKTSSQSFPIPTTLTSCTPGLTSRKLTSRR